MHLKEKVELFIHVPIADLIKVIANVNVNIVRQTKAWDSNKLRLGDVGKNSEECNKLSDPQIRGAHQTSFGRLSRKA